MREGDSVAVRVMMNLNINPQRLYTEILKVINEDEAVMNNENQIIMLLMEVIIKQQH